MHQQINKYKNEKIMIKHEILNFPIRKKKIGNYKLLHPICRLLETVVQWTLLALRRRSINKPPRLCRERSDPGANRHKGCAPKDTDQC